MNKTVLLACCDFLILATLALTSFKNSPEVQAENPIQADNSFHVDDEEDAQVDLTESFYELKLKELNEQIASTQTQLQEKNKELVNQKLLALNTRSELQKLKLELSKRSKSVYKSVLNNLWQVNISMTEDDSFSPDSFRTSFFSCAFTLNDNTYLLADFDNLGFNWAEIIADGNINSLKITLAKTGPNPWSALCKGPVFAMNQDPAICLIKLPSTRVYEPLRVLPYAKLPDYLEEVYAAKSDGRVIKVKNVSIVPNDPNWIIVDEERFLGHPDKVEKGDVLVTSDGALIGMISKEIRTGNKNRLMCLALSKLEVGEAEKVPLLKSKNDLYYKDFVNKVRLLSKQLSDN